MSRVIGDFDFLIYGTFSHADNFREHSGSDYTQINGNLAIASRRTSKRAFTLAFTTPGSNCGNAELSDTLNIATLDDALHRGLWKQRLRRHQSARSRTSASPTGPRCHDLGRLDLDSWYSQLPLSLGFCHRTERRNGASRKLTRPSISPAIATTSSSGARLGRIVDDNWFDNYNGAISNLYGGIPQFRQRRLFVPALYIQRSRSSARPIPASAFAACSSTRLKSPASHIG